MDADVPLATIVIRSLVLLGAFLARAFFAGSETAFLSADKWAIEGLASTGDRRATLLAGLAKDSRSTISALLIGTNVCTVLTSVMGASLASLLGASEAITLGVVPLAITGMLFLFTELVPKTYSAGMPTETALAVAPILSTLVRYLRPVSTILSAAPHKLAGKLSESKALPSETSDEPVRLALDLAAEEGQVDKEDGEVITGVLDSSDIRIRDVMVPIDEVTALTPETKTCEALAAFHDHRYSRLPVITPGSGSVLGVVYMKDVVREAMKAPGCVTPMKALMRPAFHASPTENLLDVLARMRKNRVHFTVVLEDGRAIGIVTMEDILTEIVGDIPEEQPGDLEERREVLALSTRSDDGMTESDGFEFATGSEP